MLKKTIFLLLVLTMPTKAFISTSMHYAVDALACTALGYILYKYIQRHNTLAHKITYLTDQVKTLQQDMQEIKITINTIDNKTDQVLHIVVGLEQKHDQLAMRLEHLKNILDSYYQHIIRLLQERIGSLEQTLDRCTKLIEQTYSAIAHK